MHFTGGFDKLNQILSFKEPWATVNKSQKQLRLENGVIINYFISTGTIQLQGKGPISEVSEIISGKIKDFESRKNAVVVSEPEKVAPVTSNETASDLVNEKTYTDSEVVIGLVGPVGTELTKIGDIITDRLKLFKYDCNRIRISTDVIVSMHNNSSETAGLSEYAKINHYMDMGNKIREETKDNSVLALGAASKIMGLRDKEGSNTKHFKRKAHVIISLKHPAEVEALRGIYSDGFFLIGISSDNSQRQKYLQEEKGMTKSEAEALIARDLDETEGYGQHTRDTFHLADFYIDMDPNELRLKNSVWRVLDLIFGQPFLTPTFDEFAMFMAFASASRSADLSRQVGAVIARNNEIIASGANDCPKAGGGLYWAEQNSKTGEYIDVAKGRDYTIGYDSNKGEQAKIIEDIVKCLELDPKEIPKLARSKIRDITEYGRVVHAEMEALMMCARNNVSARDATLYCTTFPCHNCAKHIIAAGIKKVIYIEPYPKSKAFEFHSDSITAETTEKEADRLVKFIPFVGVGPRRYFELFSMTWGSGCAIVRKDSLGNNVKWERKQANLRFQLLPLSYLDKEVVATDCFKKRERVFCNGKIGSS